MPVGEHPDLLDILGGIYDWVDPAVFGHGALNAAMLLLGGTKAVLFRLENGDNAAELLAEAGFTAGVASALIASRPMDDWLDKPRSAWLEDHVIDAAGVGFDLSEPASLAETDAELTDAPDYCLVGVVVQQASECVLISLCRPVSSGPFPEASRVLLANMLPHWRRALKLKSRQADVTDMSEAVNEVLGSMPYVILLVDSDAQVLYATERMNDSLLADSGIAVRDGRLNFADRAVAKEFKVLLDAQSDMSARATSRQAVMFRLDRLAGGQPGQMLVWPIETVSGGGKANGQIYALFINDLSSSYPLDESALRVLGHLTRTEAKLCASFYSTKNLGESASELGITASTAKSHLLSIFRKLDINSQPELMSYLAHIPKLPA